MKANTKTVSKAKSKPTPITKEEFNKLTRPEQRVIIAQDVLAQLAAKKFHPMRGNYCEIKPGKDTKGVNTTERADIDDRYIFPASLSAQALIQSAEACYVCAKGAMVCAYVERFNKRTVGGMSCMSSDETMVRIFGDNMWSEIEAQFEGNRSYRKNAVFNMMTIRQRNTPIKPKSMKSLMENVVKNKGFLKIYNHLIG